MISARLRLLPARPLRLVILTSLALAAALLPGCAVYFAEQFIEADPEEAAQRASVVTAAQVTLAWNAPSPDVQSYRLYFRIHGESDWVKVDDVPPTPNPQYTIEYSDFGTGEYDFGVIAEYDSDESVMHTSLDQTASPTAGWYLDWRQ